VSQGATTKVLTAVALQAFWRVDIQRSWEIYDHKSNCLAPERAKTL